MMMHAVGFSQFGGPEVLQLEKVGRPVPNEHEILIRVHATAVNRADILQRKGYYPAPPGESRILGLEIAGEVAALGKHVTNLQIGDFVFGLVAGGAYAEYCCLDAKMAISMPKNLTTLQAAAIPEAFFTAQETVIILGELKANESILIHAGASGVGTAAIQMAKIIGADIYFTASTDEKIQKVLALGATQGINYKTEDFYERILTLTNGNGVDVIEDFIGGDYFPKHLQLLKPCGRLIIVAYMNGAQSNIDLKLIQKKRLQIKGSVLRTRPLAEKRLVCQRFQQDWLPYFIDGKLEPVIDSIYPMAEVQAAHAYLESNQNVGKIVLQW